MCCFYLSPIWQQHLGDSWHKTQPDPGQGLVRMPLDSRQHLSNIKQPQIHNKSARKILSIGLQSFNDPFISDGKVCNTSLAEWIPPSPPFVACLRWLLVTSDHVQPPGATLAMVTLVTGPTWAEADTENWINPRLVIAEQQMNCKVTPNNIRARSAADTGGPHIMPPSIQTFQLDTRFIITRTVSTTLPHIRQTFAKTKTRRHITISFGKFPLWLCCI